MHDDDHLTQFGRDNDETNVQTPFCPVPARSEPIPLWAHRLRNYTGGGGNIEPNNYRTIKSFEYRIPGAGAYEVSVHESVGYIQSPVGIAVGAPTPREGGNSGQLRLRVNSGGIDAARVHSGRSTLVVAGEYVFVEIQIPEFAVEFDINPIGAAVAQTDSNDIVFATGSVRVLAVPARSRKPSEWRIVDNVRVQTPSSFGPIRLSPGCSGVRVIGADEGMVTTELMLSEFGPPSLTARVPVGDRIESDWMPTDGSTHLRFSSVRGPGATLAIAQRGFV